MNEPRSDAAYDVLARELKNRILQGEFADDMRLPTEAELAKQHKLSRQTVRRAYQDLVYEGVVHRIPGRGTFVSSGGHRYLRQFGSIDDLMALSVDTDLIVSEPLHRQIEISAASRLQLEGDVVYSLGFERIHEGDIFCHTEVYVPPEIGKQLEAIPELSERGARTPMTVIGFIDKRPGNPIAEASQSISAGVADEASAERLGVDVGGPLLRVDRLYYDSLGLPVELAISLFSPRHYSYRVRLRRTSK